MSAKHNKVMRNEPERKDLKRLFPYYSHMVMVLDDKTTVWARDIYNILQVYPYVFWNAVLAPVVKDETLQSEKETQLMDSLDVLRKIHSIYYQRGVNDCECNDIYIMYMLVSFFSI